MDSVVVHVVQIRVHLIGPIERSGGDLEIIKSLHKLSMLSLVPSEVVGNKNTTNTTMVDVIIRRILKKSKVTLNESLFSDEILPIVSMCQMLLSKAGGIFHHVVIAVHPAKIHKAVFPPYNQWDTVQHGQADRDGVDPYVGVHVGIAHLPESDTVHFF